MNYEKIDIAKKIFYEIYTDGFEDEKMEHVKKKHKTCKMHELSCELFTREAFNRTDDLLNSWVKVVGRSSMVSVFDKPKFRDIVKYMALGEKEILVNGLKEFLYGDKAFGFQSMIDILSEYKLAKWTLLTIVPYYLKPQEEVFIKPTTTKNAISFFELDGVKYSPKATYEFYKEYKQRFLELKKEVGVTDDNAAFGGFIMISTGMV